MMNSLKEVWRFCLQSIRENPPRDYIVIRRWLKIRWIRKTRAMLIERDYERWHTELAQQGWYRNK